MIVYTVGLSAIVYTALYFHFYAKKPQVYLKDKSALHKLLVKYVPAMQQPYNPPYWGPQGHFQTIVKNFIPANRAISYRREVVPSIDGGQFYIDWADNSSSSSYRDDATRPTIFIVPGLTSTSKSNYVMSMVDVLTQHGYRCMVIINRGLDGMKVLTPKAYCATHTIDMELVIDMFKDRYPNAPLMVIGISLGSLMVGRYLSLQNEKSTKLVGAMLFSCPFSPVEGSKSLQKLENRILFNYHLTKGLKRLYSRFSGLFEDVVDHKVVMSSCTIRDYDSSFTARVFGYSSVDEYYKDAVLTEDKLKAIQVPTLCVNSDDDPFSPYYALPFDGMRRSENVALIVTHGGGHVSHMQGNNPFAKTYFEKVMEEFVKGVFAEVNSR